MDYYPITMIRKVRTYRDHSAEILTLASEGAKKTQLVYKANLNFNLIRDQLEILIHTGLMEKQDREYFTTDKGKQFLYHFSSMTELITYV